MSNVDLREPVVATEQEQVALKSMVRILEFPVRPKLVGPDGQQIELTEALYYVLANAAEMLAAGHAVSLIPYNKELTSQEAADILNVSRPFLIKLLNEGAIPFTKTGTHRRIRYVDLIKYKHQRDAERRHGMRDLSQLGQEMGLY